MSSRPQPRSFAAELRGFGPLGIAAIVLVLAGNLLFAPLSALLVLLWRWQADVAWRDIGFSRPRSWFATITLGIVLGAVLKLLMKALVMPSLGGPAINPTYHFIASNTPVLPQIIVTMIFVAGFGEEILFRGYMFERLRRLWGTRFKATAAIVLLTTAVFAAAHLPDQGVAGAEQALIVGATYAGLYLLTGSLWLSIVTHAAFDLTAVAIIYFNLEAAIAHSIIN